MVGPIAHPEAMYTVAVCHEFGQGVTKSMAEAIRWYRRAAAAGVTEAAAEGGRQRPGCHHFRFWCARLRRAGKRKGGGY